MSFIRCTIGKTFKKEVCQQPPEGKEGIRPSMSIEKKSDKCLEEDS